MTTLALVDDDENIIASLKIFFEAEGYQVRTYHDGLTALGALTDSPPDLAILDVKMPKMDGLELLRRLRATHDLPVIYLTSKDDEIDELIGLKMGADDYITKPFSQRLLIERVRTILRRTKARQVARAPPLSLLPVCIGSLGMPSHRILPAAEVLIYHFHGRHERLPKRGCRYFPTGHQRELHQHRVPPLHRLHRGNTAR
mgnify:CR=1 FL=1